jgi:hypothetical protein
MGMYDKPYDEDVDVRTVSKWGGAKVDYYAIYITPRLRVAIWRFNGWKAQILDNRGPDQLVVSWDITQLPSSMSPYDVCRVTTAAVIATENLEVALTTRERAEGIVKGSGTATEEGGE